MNNIKRPFRIIMAGVLTMIFLVQYTPSSVNASTKPAVFCSYNHSLALKEDGTVWTWGNNVYGQLGDGSSRNRSKPVQIRQLQNAKAIAGGYGVSYTLMENNALYGWGRNLRSTPYRLQEIFRRYYDSRFDASEPIKLSVPVEASAIASGSDQLCAYKPGNNTLAIQDTLNIGGGPQIRFVSSSFPGSFKCIAPCPNMGWLLLDDNNMVWHKMDDKSEVTRVDSLDNIVSIAADSHYAALKADGTVWTWGRNYYGQLGDGTKMDRATPQKVREIDHVVQIAVAGGRTLALKDDGSVYAWGISGVLEDRDDQESHDGFTILVTKDPPRGVMFAEREDNRIAITTPTKIRELSNIVYIAAGDCHCLAIKDDGTVWAWGYNDFGQLGDGTNTNRAKPVMIKDFNVLKPVVNPKPESSKQPIQVSTN